MRRLTPLGGAACGNVDNANAFPQSHEAEQNQKKRTYEVLPKPDNLIRYRQRLLPPRTRAQAAGSLAGVLPNRRLNDAETWWRSIATRLSPSDVTQLNWMTRRSPEKGLCPCQELSARLKASSVPAPGGTSMIMSSRLSADLSSRSRPPECSHSGFM